MLVSSTSAQPLRLTDVETNDASPVWSPDGSRIAFSRQEAEGYGVFTIPALGGAPRRLTSTTSEFPGLSYGADGSSLAIVDRVSEDGPHGIFILSTETGERTLLTHPDTNARVGDTHPVFSRDRQKVAFVRDGDAYVVAAAGGEPDRLSIDAAGIDGIAWTPDGRYVVYSAESRLWSVPASGGEAQPIDSLEGDAITPTIGPDTRLVYASDGNLFLARPTVTP